MQGAFSVPNFVDWKAASRAVEDTAAVWQRHRSTSAAAASPSGCRPPG